MWRGVCFGNGARLPAGISNTGLTPAINYEITLPSYMFFSTTSNFEYLLATSAMSGGMDDDEYVANLLVQDAKDSTKKYELVGIDAFNPRRCVASLNVLFSTEKCNCAVLSRIAAI